MLFRLVLGGAYVAPPFSRPSDHTKVFRDLVKAFPKTMLWGSDSPAYSYIAKRRYSDGSIVDFKLVGAYDMETAVIDALPGAKRYQVASRNTRRFLFG